MRRITPPSTGLAMPLVLISLATATIVTVAYVSSRDNSTMVGENVAASLEAQTSAASAIDLGVAIMQTMTDWKTTHINGKLLNDYVLGDALIDIDVLDMSTLEPPTEDTMNLLLVCTAVVDGVEHIATAEAKLGQPDVDGGFAAVGLGEFAVFANDTVSLHGNATSMRWPKAPASNQGRRVLFGTKGTALGTISIADNAAAIDCSVYHGPGASGSLVLNTGPSIRTTGLADPIPLPAPPNHRVADPAEPDLDPALDLAANMLTINANTRYSELLINADGHLVVQGDLTLVVNRVVQLSSGGRITIDGNVRMVVFSDVFLTNGAIEVVDDARLTLFVGGDLVLDDSYLGLQREPGDDTRDASGGAPWIHPSRIRIIGAPALPVPPYQAWSFNGNSVAQGSVYAPTAIFTINGDSAHYGNVACQSFAMNDFAGLFYDHALDKDCGYTSDDSPLFDDGARLKTEVLALASLDGTDMQALADALGCQVKEGDADYGDKGLQPPAGGGPLDPTPRPVPVEVVVTSNGGNVSVWESQFANAQGKALGGGGATNEKGERGGQFAEGGFN